jgi:hypothetical protein
MRHDLILLTLGAVRAAMWLAGAWVAWSAAKRLTESKAPLIAVATGFALQAFLSVLGGFRNGGWALSDWLLQVLFYAPTLSVVLIVGGSALALEIRVSRRQGKRWVPWRRS